MDGLLDLYVGYLRAERGLAGLTVNAYATDLRRYLDGLKHSAISHAKDIRVDHVRSHLSSLIRKGMSARSQARHLSSIRSFHRFLVNEGVTTHDPTENIDSPKPDKRLPVFLSVEEVEALLRAPGQESPAAKRDLAMLEMLYATGLRVSELVKLSVNDLNLSAGYLIALGKGRKERMVPVGSRAREAVVEYLGGPRQALLKGRTSRSLFVTLRGEG